MVAVLLGPLLWFLPELIGGSAETLIHIQEIDFAAKHNSAPI